MNSSRLKHLLLPLCLMFFLPACDIAPDYRLSQSPLGGQTSTSVSAEDAANIVAYFYAGLHTGAESVPGVPVAGLLYECRQSGGQRLIDGVTDENGMFVCPRNTTVLFSVGSRTLGLIRLGEIELSIFGNADSGTSRSPVAITPGTLYGTATDAERNEVANVFNLLASLSHQQTFNAHRQKKVLLSSAIHDSFALDPETAELDLRSSRSLFARDLEKIIQRMNATGAELQLAKGRPTAPVLDLAEVEELTNASLLRARAGLYRIPTLINDVGVDGKTVNINATFWLDGRGKANGLLSYIESAGAGTKFLTSTLTLNPGAKVKPDGTLFDFWFGDIAKPLEFTGSLVNDAVYSESRLCPDPSVNANTDLPASYCGVPASMGGVSLLDAGKFSWGSNYEGDLYLWRFAENLPDIDLDLLPGDYALPRTYQMELGRYPDISKADFANKTLASETGDKAAFGTPLTAMPILRYTVMPNGDIVSDKDDDCKGLELTDDGYQDADGDREYLLGRVGNVFRVNLAADGQAEDYRAYMTMHFAILDPAVDADPEMPSKYYGLNIGYSAYNRTLGPVVLSVSDGKLIPKRCDPKAVSSCRIKTEWFNEVNFLNEVSYPALTNATASSGSGSTSGLTEEELDELFKNGTYLGQVTGHSERHEPFSPICSEFPAEPSPTP